MTLGWKPRLGAVRLEGGGTRFRVWAPHARNPAVRLVSPVERRIPLAARSHGWYEATIDGIDPGARYFYDLGEGKERPDPASRHQPEGVHGPSEVVNVDFGWTDDHWHGISLSKYIIYELHIGTFTEAGTFESAIAELDRLVELGITAVEIMPVAQFPGGRNWGYDGVGLFAPQSTYGGPDDLKKLVDACHAQGLAVVLDVVYNHLGPEGNYLRDFGPYFTDRYHTPWGEALNFDGPDSDQVREFFIENALYWVTEFHIDALRLDAVHAILDQSARPFLQELAAAVHRQAVHLDRRIHVIAESDAGDARLIRSTDAGGYGLDAQWNDDFHHAVHAALTGERSGYYHDFGTIAQIAESYQHGFVFRGQYSAYRRRRHGADTRKLSGKRFVVCVQNHDQVGNRMLGERIDNLVDFERRKLAVGLLLLSPFIPLLFMGEEYGETAPFQYFVSHTDPGLVQAVREGRKREFASFGWKGEPPDPQSEETFRRCVLRPEQRNEGRHAALYDLYRTLIRLRRTLTPLAELSPETQNVVSAPEADAFTVVRTAAGESIAAFFHFGESATKLPLPRGEGTWHKCIASSDARFGGAGDELPDQLPATEQRPLEMPPGAFALYRLSSEESTA